MQWGSQIHIDTLTKKTKQKMKGGTEPTMEMMNDLHGVGSPRTTKRRRCTVLRFARQRRISSFLYLSKLIQNPYRAKSKSITPTVPPHPNSSNHTLHKTITSKTSRKTNIQLKLMSEPDNCVYCQMTMLHLNVNSTHTHLLCFPHFHVIHSILNKQQASSFNNPISNAFYVRKKGKKKKEHKGEKKTHRKRKRLFGRGEHDSRVGGCVWVSIRGWRG